MFCVRLSLSLGYGTKCNNILVRTTVTIPQSQLPTPIPAPNVIPLCTTTFAVPNVIMMIGLILVTVPNAFSDSLLINPLCAHAGFERFTDRE